MTLNESPNGFGITWVRGQNKVLVWILLIAMTVLLLLYPVSLTNEYYSIQAPYLFDNLWLFGTLFCIWMLLLLLVIFSFRDTDRLCWEGLLLACILALVFLGFWVIITPFGSYADTIYNMGHVKYLIETGKIPVDYTTLGYFEFPGMHILVAVVSQISGLDVFESTIVFLIFNSMLFSVLIYIFYTKLIKSNRLSILGTSIVLMGSIVLVEKMHIFTPGAYGFSLLAGLLIFLVPSDSKLSGTTISKRLLMLILFATMTISYFPASALFPLILIVIYAIQWMVESRELPVTFASIILLLVMVLTWAMYWTLRTFGNLVAFLPKLVGNLAEGDFLSTVLILASSSAGARLPLWAIVTRYFWWGLIGLVTIMGLSKLVRIQKLSSIEQLEIGGLLGVILFTTIGLVSVERGSQFYRYLLYAPLFCSPILLSFLLKSGSWSKKVPALLIIPVIVFALPTFLVSVNTVSTDAIYRYECTAGEFLGYHSGEKGKELVLFRASDVSTAWAFYYIPNASYSSIPMRAYYSKNQDYLWQELDILVADFKDARYSPDKQKLFTISKKSTIVFQHLLDIPTDHPKWQEIMQKLSTTNLIYTNGHLKLYNR